MALHLFLKTDKTEHLLAEQCCDTALKYSMCDKPPQYSTAEGAVRALTAVKMVQEDTKFLCSTGPNQKYYANVLEQAAGLTGCSFLKVLQKEADNHR
jgi:hypothetical protein